MPNHCLLEKKLKNENERKGENIELSPIGFLSVCHFISRLFQKRVRQAVPFSGRPGDASLLAE